MRHKSHGCGQAGCRQRDSAPPPDRPGRSGCVLDAPAVAVDTARFRQTRDSAALSSDAGTFVCNSLFYHLLNWSAGQERRILSGFVSLPIVNGRPHERGLSIEQQTAAVDDVLRESVRYFPATLVKRHSAWLRTAPLSTARFSATCESCGFDTWSRTYRHTPDGLFRTISVLSVRIMHFVLRAAC